MTEITKGSCLCGGVSYTINGALSNVTTCHCRQCRKQSGHYYAAARTQQSHFQIKDEDGLIKWYRSSDEASRGFCSNCGSALFWKYDNSSYMSVLVGSIDGDTNLETGEHIFIESKGDYYQLDDNIPQFQTIDPSR